MAEYHKIEGPFTRVMEGEHKGRVLRDSWREPWMHMLADVPWHWTEKVDGMNIRIEMCEEGHVRFAGRTDKANIHPELIERLTTLFPLGCMVEKFGLGQPVTFYGEGYGPGIQKGGGYRADKDFILFDVKVGSYWLEPHNVEDIADSMGIPVLRPLPEIMGYTLRDATRQLAMPHASSLAIFNGGSESQLMEGVVGRNIVPLFDRHGNRLIVKVKHKDMSRALETAPA